MNLTEARQECLRYLAYLEREEAKSKALQVLASDRRASRCDDREKDRRLAEIMGANPTVYDGGNLAEAIKALLKAAGEDRG
jgi:hypothetical protein